MLIRLQKEIVFFFVLFFGTSLFVFWLFNGGAYAKNIRYNLFLHSPFANADLKTGKILEVNRKTLDTTNPATNQTLPPAATEKSEEKYRITIPKIFVSSPLVIPKSDTVKDILTSLEYGVGLYPGSSFPGYQGRAIVLGHSSRPFVYHGDYATTFSLLGKLEIGDQIFIIDGNKKYTYTVFNTQILTPQETNAALAETPTVESELDLITCWPIGSSSKRTFVQAKLTATETE